MNNFFEAVVAVIIVSLISLIGVVGLAINKKRLNKITSLLVALAAGTLIGDAFLHIVPEGFEHLDRRVGGLILISGIFSFYILENILNWRHCHQDTDNDYKHHLRAVNLVGDGLHNFIDGLIIAGSFAVSIEVGLATAIAVTLHEIPQEIGDFGVLIYSGIKIKKGLFYNFLSALAAVLGLLVYILLGSWVGDWSKFILMFAGGGFIYIAVADLIPEMKHTCSRKKALGRLFIMLCGVGLMYLLTVLHVE